MHHSTRRAPKPVQHAARLTAALLIITVVIVLPALFWQAGVALGLFLIGVVAHPRMWQFSFRPDTQHSRVGGAR